MRLRKFVPFVLAFVSASPLMAATPVEPASESPDLFAYALAVRAAGNDPAKLKRTTTVLFGGEIVPLETGWTRWGAGPASQETLRALEGRVDVARYQRPTAFSPEEIRRRLSTLLDRLNPSRVRGLGAAADEPVNAHVTNWTPGTWHTGHVFGSGCCNHGGTSGGYTYASSGGSGGGGHSSSYGGGYSGGHSSGGGSSHTSRQTTYPRRDPVRTSSTSTSTTRGQQNPVQQTQQRNPVNPTRTRPNYQPPPRQVQSSSTTQPVQTTTSRPTEVALTPPPKPPAVEPPPPPPTTLIKPEQKSTSWVTVILAVLLAALPMAAYMFWRSRRKPAAPPPMAPPKSVADLVDPEHVGLGSVALGQIGRKSAEEEDWMRAMRYLFAALLTFLAEQRRIPIRDFHTNKEIANLVGKDAKLAENFWSAATIFELFWFGQKRPMENDFRMFEMMAHECMSRLGVGA